MSTDWGDRSMKSVFVAAGIISIFMLGTSSAGAQHDNTPETPAAVNAEPKQTSVLDSLTYIFSGEDRSQKFDRLRRQRSVLSRNINAQEAQIRELLQQNAKYEEEIAAIK